MKTAGPSQFSDMAAHQLLTVSPLGPLTLSGTGEALTGLAFGDVREAGDRPSQSGEMPDPCGCEGRARCCGGAGGVFCRSAAGIYRAVSPGGIKLPEEGLGRAAGGALWNHGHL